MNSVIKHSLLLTICLGVAPAFASAGTDLSALLNKMKTMRANFTQTIFDNNNKAVQKSTGKMALDRPGKFRWEVNQPMPQVIIANETRLWIYDPDLQQVTIRSLNAEAGEAPALLLSHQNTKLESDYAISKGGSRDSLNWYVMKPKKKDNMFSLVKMGFDGKQQLKEMELQDQIGHATRVQFTKIELNASVPASLFTFKAPAGTDVIDETKQSA